MKRGGEQIVHGSGQHRQFLQRGRGAKCQLMIRVRRPQAAQRRHRRQQVIEAQRAEYWHRGAAHGQDASCDEQTTISRTWHPGDRRNAWITVAPRPAGD
jgi:hypothetical protein